MARSKSSAKPRDGKRPPPAPALEPAVLWFHPSSGALITTSPLPHELLRHRERHGFAWREVMKLRMELDEHGLPRPVPGQKLPKGFLWGDPSKQRYGMGGPKEVFGPLDKLCRDCKEPFVFTAAAQKELAEETDAFIDATAVRCLACCHRKNKLENARRAHAAALSALDIGAAVTAAHFLAAARAALELLAAGGSTSIDRAIGYCRKAKKLGAKAAETVEQKLVAVRTERAAERANTKPAGRRRLG